MFFPQQNLHKHLFHIRLYGLKYHRKCIYIMLDPEYISSRYTSCITVYKAFMISKSINTHSHKQRLETTYTDIYISTKRFRFGVCPLDKILSALHLQLKATTVRVYLFFQAKPHTHIHTNPTNTYLSFSL